ncbi:MAG: PAS domain-containing protein, partial [Deltaproteobacteria bacterium]|nr:PAS domain-containing protein [Deltaproteobacteria bacterium]
EALAKLKKLVNLTAANLREILDLSHEFAIGLAEHFDVLHKVTEGDLTARVGGSSEVELLEALKRMTNQMIESVATEIEHRKRAEKEARRQTEFLNLVLESLPHPFYVIDAFNYQIKLANSAAYQGPFFKNMTCYALTHKAEKPCGPERHPCPLETIKRTKQPAVVEHLHYDSRGNARNVEVHGYPIFDDEGNVVQIVASSLDITESLIKETQLIQASKMATMGEMSTGVAHELNQPLSVIKTASSFLIKKVRNREDIKAEILRTLAEEIDSHVDRAFKIIKHMREFGRKSEVKRVPVQVNDPLSKALEIFSRQLKLRDIEVIVNLADDLPVIMADANRLEQVFINLLINARDAIEEKWTAQDRRPDEKKRIEIESRLREGKVTVEVSDTGVGIDDAIVDKIFEPFFTTKNVDKGTGLGLSISYGIIKDYSGTIEVESVKGCKTTFRITFPAAQKREKAV